MLFDVSLLYIYKLFSFFQGYMPTKAVLEKYDLLQLWGVVQAVKRGCISDLDNVMQEHQTFFTKCGIYLIIEKLKIITYRNLFKKV